MEKVNPISTPPIEQKPSTELELSKTITKSQLIKRISIPTVSIVISFTLGTFILLIMGKNPIIALKSMFIDVFFDQNGQIELTTLGNVFFYSTPLILAGLSVAVAFRAGMFNIGTEGQIVIGGFTTALIGSALYGAGYNLPSIIMIPLLIIVGLIAGSLWAFIPAVLKTRGVHEVISTIMMNYVANTLMIFLIGDIAAPFSDKKLAGNASPQTPPISPAGRIPTIFGRNISLLDWGFVINILVCVIIYIILWRTQLGYETRAVGYNKNAAKYGGISVNRNLFVVMMIAGALGGLAGSLIVMGPLYGFFLYGSTSGLGFDGIAVALIGENHPFGVILSAILFGWLQASTTKLQQNKIPKDIANTMKGFMVFIVAIPLFSQMIIDSISKSNWGNKAFTYYREATKENASLGNRIIQSMNFVLFVVYFFLIATMDTLLNFSKRTFVYLKEKKMNTSVTILFIISFISYLNLATMLSSEVDEFLSSLILISLLSEISRSFYEFNSELYLTIVSVLFTLAALIGFYILRRYDIACEIQRLLLIFSIPFVIFSFFNLINLLGQDIVLLASLLIIIIFVSYQEFKARDTKRLSSSSTEKGIRLNNIEINRKRVVKYYSITILCLLILILSIIMTGTTLLPRLFDLSEEINNLRVITLPQLWIFNEKSNNLLFLQLPTLSSALSFIGILFISATLFFLRKLELPRMRSEVYYLPSITLVITIIYSIIALAEIFSLNPFTLLTQTLSIAAPIGFAALGGMYSEKTGVVNIGLEGMMLIGAFSAVWFTYMTGDPWIGVLGAIISGGIMGFVHALASIKFRADQVVVGVALNILASALTMLGLVFVWDIRGTSPVITGLPNVKIPFLEEIPVVGRFLYLLVGSDRGISPLVYLFIFLIFISYWIIERTSFGLRARAVGEHPRAADTLGINVFKMRYICVIISGILAALGGAQLTIGWSPVFGRDMTSGRGFVALAALIFGGWSPIGAGLASLLFGFAITFRYLLEAQGISWAINILGFNWFLEKLLLMLPYIVTLIAVATVAKRMRPPAADGVPYKKEG